MKSKNPLILRVSLTRDSKGCDITPEILSCEEISSDIMEIHTPEEISRHFWKIISDTTAELDLSHETEIRIRIEEVTE